MTSIFETYVKSSSANIKGFLIGMLHVLLEDSGSAKSHTGLRTRISEVETVNAFTKAGFTKDNVKEAFLSAYLSLKPKNQKELLTELLSTDFESREKIEDLFCELIEQINDLEISADDYIDVNLLNAISDFGSAKALNVAIKSSDLDINQTAQHEVINESCFQCLCSHQRDTVDSVYLSYVEALIEHNVDTGISANRDALMGLLGFIEYAEVLGNKGFLLQDILATKWQPLLESHAPVNYMENTVGQWLNAHSDIEHDNALATINLLAEQGVENCAPHLRIFFDKNLMTTFFYKKSREIHTRYKKTRVTKQTIIFIQRTSTFLGENWLWDNNQSNFFGVINRNYASEWGKVIAKAIFSELPLPYLAKAVRNVRDATKLIQHFDISAYDLMLLIDNDKVKGEVLDLMDA